jgi:hypothetical protein
MGSTGVFFYIDVLDDEMMIEQRHGVPRVEAVVQMITFKLQKNGLQLFMSQLSPPSIVCTSLVFWFFIHWMDLLVHLRKCGRNL